MATYSTPGVYVEEISKFPPSVAAVETAIPAFIGYTEKATFRGKNLENKAIRISSLLEYEERFGSGPSVDVANVSLDENNNVVSTTLNSTYYLYDGLRMFFDNGGGDCYIISIGLYTAPASVQQADLERGLEEVLVKVDEPTLIVFPDGIALTQVQLSDIYKKALDQCNTLKDRFLVADVHVTDPSFGSVDFTNDIDVFRSNIGTKYLSYGAAYYPYIESSIGRDISYRDIKDKVKKLGATVNWNDFVDPADTDALALIAEMNQIVNDLTGSIEPDLRNFIAAQDAAFTEVKIATLEDVYLALRAEFYALARDPASSITDVRNAFIALLDYIYEITGTFIDSYTSTAPGALSLPELVATIENAATELATVATDPAGNPTLDTLVKFDNNASDAAAIFSAAGSFPVFPAAGWSFAAFTSMFVGGNNDPALNAMLPFPAPADSAERIQNMMAIEPLVRTVFYKVYQAITSYMEDAHNLEVQKETSMILQIPVLKNVIESLEEEYFLLPPSSAVAGIYASVDSDRGVFKAPANISISSVTRPVVNVTLSENDRLNIDVNAGKSINVIKSFTGKGTLVWGARTLAGNDNEWRYIPVRRFFIFAEESIKKATEPFVFEPNDANTWTKVKAMITNFLIVQWRTGALAGAKPSHAFYVKVGLGETMTPLDILEGRMIVEIGMAVVRPAEFIILRFAHKMQES